MKSKVFLVFGIELLAIAIAISRAILLQRSPMRYFGEGGFITWLSICQLLFLAFLCWKISCLRPTRLALHRFLNLNESGITGRIDDVLILIYVVLGLFFLRLFKPEFQKFTRSFGWFLTGFVLSFLTIFLDMLSHNRGILSPWIDNLEKLNTMHHWLTDIEEIPKIFAEGAFIIAFYHCLKIAKKLNKSNLT